MVLLHKEEADGAEGVDIDMIGRVSSVHKVLLEYGG